MSTKPCSGCGFPLDEYGPALCPSCELKFQKRKVREAKWASRKPFLGAGTLLILIIGVLIVFYYDGLLPKCDALPKWGLGEDEKPVQNTVLPSRPMPAPAPVPALPVGPKNEPWGGPNFFGQN